MTWCPIRHLMRVLSLPSPAQIGDAWNLASAVVFGIHLLRTELHSRALPQNKALPIIALQVCGKIHLFDFTYTISDHVIHITIHVIVLGYSGFYFGHFQLHRQCDRWLELGIGLS